MAIPRHLRIPTSVASVAAFPSIQSFIPLTIPSKPGSADSFPKDPLQDIDLGSFARRFREGTLRAEATTEAYLQRIAVVDSAIGAFRAVDASAALRRAREIDSQRRAGRDLGPLMGLPVAVKE